MQIRIQSTPADIEEKLLEILRKNRPGTDVRGCHSHMEIYDRAVQREILQPLWRARAEAGIIGEIDDDGHDTEFVAAWNRAVRGTSGNWDCRSLTLPFVRAACRDVPDFFEKVFAGDFDAIDDAILRNLPDILAGPGLKSPATCEGLTSWVDGKHLWFCMEGPQIRFCNKLGGALEKALELPAHIEIKAPASAENAETSGPVRYFGMMSFHGKGIPYEEGQKAWQAWRDAADAAEICQRYQAESMLGLAVRTLGSRQKLGFASQSLRQDERVSIEAKPEGFIVYLGSVKGLPDLVDEGQFFCGPRAAFAEMLQGGGFGEDDAESYLDRLIASGSAFGAEVPAGSAERILIDAETLYGFDCEADEMAKSDRPEAALPILAVGTFAMPEMLSHRARQVPKRDYVLDDPSP